MRQKRHTPKPKRLTYINKWDTPFRRLYCSKLHPSTGMFNFLLATFLKDLLRCARRPTAYSVSVAEGSGAKQPFEVLCISNCLYCCVSRSVNEYLAETEVAMTKAETGEFLFDDLRELAANHAQQKIEFEKLIPENISLGLFVVGTET